MPVGRPLTLFTKKRQSTIIRAVRRGNTRSCAAGLAGIDLSTLMEWLRRGRNGEEPFVLFAEQLRLADAWIEDKLVGVVTTHAALKNKSVQASMAWLGLRRRKTWHEQADIKVTHTGAGPDYSLLSSDELDTMLALQKKTMKKDDET